MKSPKFCKPPSGPRAGISTRLFWNQVARGEADECWLWNGAITSRGYGTYGKPQRQAHRMAYVLTHGRFPDRLEIRHLCESRYPAGDFTCRRCCNPAQLAPGTHFENMRDKKATGRAKGRRGVAREERLQP